MELSKKTIDTVHLGPAERFEYEGIQVRTLTLMRYAGPLYGERVDSLTGIDMHGCKLKQDGKAGRTRADRYLYANEVKAALPPALYEALRYEGIIRYSDFEGPR